MKSQFLFPAFPCHAHITNQLYRKVLTSSVNENGTKRVRNGPKNYLKIKVSNMENFDTVGKSIKNMTKNAEKSMPENVPAKAMRHLSWCRSQRDQSQKFRSRQI